MNHIQPKFLFTSTLTLAIALFNLPVSAGEIVPSIETNTLVNQNGNLFTIMGGELSSDGQNLFHKFPQFNLYLNEIIDFKTNPNLTNLVVGVNGGNPSFIDGLIRLTGSNANFLLINPSGIAFGKNASIDLPADLHLSTANKVGFSNGQFFDVLGENNYQNLIGNPESFIFDASQASGIINEGNLELKDSGNLSVTAGGIISTGTIDAGNVIIQAIPGSSKVKLTPKGSFVSYEIELPRDESGNLKSFTLYDLTKILLAQNSLSNEISLNGDGTLQVNDINIPNENGLNILSGNVDTSSIDGIGGDIKVLGEKIAVIGNSQLDASGELGGGNINIGGSFQGQGELQNSQTTYVGQDVAILADALTTGNAGDVVIWADGTTAYYGNIFARGGQLSGDAGFVEISGKENLGFAGSVFLDSPNGKIGTLLLDPRDIVISNAPTTSGVILPQVFKNDFAGTDININAADLLDQTGNIRLEASRDIEFQDTSKTNGSIDFAVGTGDILFHASNQFKVTGTSTFRTLGRNLEIQAGSGGIQAPGTIFGSNSSGLGGNAGNITFTSDGDINVQAIFARSASEAGGSRDPNGVGDGRGGDITITTGGELILGAIDNGDPIDDPFSNNVSIRTSGEAYGGTVKITASEIFIPYQISAFANTNPAITDNTNIGSIELTANQIRVGGINAEKTTIKTNELIIIDDFTVSQADLTRYAINTRNATGSTFSISSIDQGESTVISIPDRATISSLFTLENDLLISSTGNTVIFNGNINSTQDSNLTILDDFQLTGQIGESGSIRSIDVQGLFTLNSPTTNTNVVINTGALKSTGNQQYNTPITLGTDTNFVSDGVIDFFDSGTNFPSVFGNVSLQFSPVTPSQNVFINGIGAGLSLPNLDLLADGFTLITIGDTDGSGQYNIVNQLNISDPLIIQSPLGNINVGNFIDANDNAQITMSASKIFLDSDLTTNNQNIEINGTTILENNVNIDTGTGAGNIDFNGSITGTNKTLDTRSGLGETTLGNSVLVFDINLNTASNVNLAGDLTVTNPNGNLEFNNPTTLTNKVNLTTAGGDITNNNTINSQTGTNFNLGINPAGGSFTNNAAIGGTQSVGNVVINNAQNVESNAPIEVLSFTINNANKVTLNSDLIANGSAVDITANNDITTTNVTTNGGDINLVSSTGNILTGNLNSSNAGGTGGSVTAIALGNPNSTITTNNINSSGNIGGNVNLQAIQTVTTNEIFARGTVGNGGNVTIDPVNVVVNFIDAQGGAFGTGGNVDITATEFFRATGGFIDDTGIFSSISTTGGAGSGSITIRHAGGDLFVPFIVGDPSINGTAGALNTGAFTIAPYQVFPGSYYFGNISIITGDRFQNELNKATNIRIPELEPAVEIEDNGFFIDEYFTRVYERYFTGNLLAEELRIKSFDEIRDELAAVEDATGIKPALIYALFQPKSVPAGCIDSEQVKKQDPTTEILTVEFISNEKESCIKNPLTFKETDDDILTLVMVTSDESAKVEIVPGATRKEVRQKAKEIVNELTITPQSNDDFYQDSASKLYDWLIKPLIDSGDSKIIVNQKPITNISFILDDLLSTIPVAAMIKEIKNEDECDQSQSVENCVVFIIEDYSTGLMPSMSLTEAYYKKINDLKLRISGATTFPDFFEREDLPFNQIQQEVLPQIWQPEESELIIDKKFTTPEIIKAQNDDPNGILHWMTHATFKSDQSNSYVLFSDKKLNLEELRSVKLKDVSLFVLNACETAVGDRNASLGFAGLAYKTQAQSVLGSIWEVENDSATAIMLKFYNELRHPSFAIEPKFQDSITKAQAFQQVQRSMLRGEISLKKNNDDNLFLSFGSTVQGNLKPQYDVSNICPEQDRDPEIENCNYRTTNYQHPHYWSAFTLVGSPW